MLVNLRQQVSSSQNSLARANAEYREIEHKLALCAEEMAVYNELEWHGIFLSDLIFLRNKDNEIAQANMESYNNYQILTPSNAFKKLLKDVETQYDPKVGFERDLQKAEALLKRAQQENQSFMQEYSKKRYVRQSRGAI
jgi:multidrug efflux pump subunit AcrA (membrane-fusion protein)